MKPVQIVYSPTAKEYLRHLYPDLKKSLREAIEELLADPRKGKPLREEFDGFRSHRFKRYRIIYRYREDKHRVEIAFAGGRSDVYRLFSDYLKKLNG